MKTASMLMALVLSVFSLANKVWAEDSFTNSLGMSFRLIPAGEFVIGSPADEPGRDNHETAHPVTLTKPYFMQTTEVTQGQWRAVMGTNPSFFSNCGDDCPVESVSWEAVQAFLAELNKRGAGIYRLLTEAEWEFAVRAGTTTPFSTGDCLGADQVNYRASRPLADCPAGVDRGKPVPVASFAPNAWGLCDMHENVREWVQDWDGDYRASAATDPAGPASCTRRVERGGSWFSDEAECRSAYRSSVRPGGHSYDLGFRLVRIS